MQGVFYKHWHHRTIPNFITHTYVQGGRGGFCLGQFYCVIADVQNTCVRHARRQHQQNNQNPVHISPTKKPSQKMTVGVFEKSIRK
jgi:hypothetical protein